MKPFITAVLATITTFVLFGGSLVTAGQETTGTPRPRLVSPVRGEAKIAHTAPVSNRVGNEIVTTLEVQNLSNAPIAGFKVEEFWYDSSNNLVPGASEVVRRPIFPNEIVEIELHTPANQRMNRNSYRFSHANGTIKNEQRKELVEPEEEAGQ